MDKGFVTFCICVMLCLLGFGFMFFALGLNEQTVEPVKPVETVEKPVENSVVCEHDWVITSEYSVWGRGYRTISKCSKCGEVVR